MWRQCAQTGVDLLVRQHPEQHGHALRCETTQRIRQRGNARGVVCTVHYAQRGTAERLLSAGHPHRRQPLCHVIGGDRESFFAEQTRRFDRGERVAHLFPPGQCQLPFACVVSEPQMVPILRQHRGGVCTRLVHGQPEPGSGFPDNAQRLGRLVGGGDDTARGFENAAFLTGDRCDGVAQNSGVIARNGGKHCQKRRG